jgi:hypothetical protein
MDLVYDVFVIAHLLGMASLVGGFFAYNRGLDATLLMVQGARAQVVTGLILVGLAEVVDSLDKDLDMAKIGTKLVVALAAAACIEIGRGRLKKGRNATRLVQVAGALGVLNVLVAAGWN